MHRPKGTGKRAQMTANTEFTQHNLRSGLFIKGNGIYWTGIHAPRFIALHARVGCIARFLIKDVHTDEALRRLKGSGLDPGARQFTLPATGTTGGYDFKSFGH
jgi:hypothetical protein